MPSHDDVSLGEVYRMVERINSTMDRMAEQVITIPVFESWRQHNGERFGAVEKVQGELWAELRGVNGEVDKLRELMEAKSREILLLTEERAQEREGRKERRTSFVWPVAAGTSVAAAGVLIAALWQ